MQRPGQSPGCCYELSLRLSRGVWRNPGSVSCRYIKGWFGLACSQCVFKPADKDGDECQPNILYEKSIFRVGRAKLPEFDGGRVTNCHVLRCPRPVLTDVLTFYCVAEAVTLDLSPLSPLLFSPSGRFHQPPPNAWNSAALSPKRLVRACTRVTSDC